MLNNSVEKRFFQIIYDHMLERSQSRTQPLYLSELIDRMNLKELKEGEIIEKVPRFSALRVYFVSKEKGYISLHIGPDSEEVAILLTSKGLKHLNELGIK